MNHWLDGFAKILESSGLNIIKLAEIANIDPTYVYQHADLSQCDLRGQDLTNIDLTGAILEGALLDSATRLDRTIDPRINSRGYFFFRINARLVRYVNSEAHYAGYTYAVWFVKHIFEMLYNLKDVPQFKYFIEELYELNFEEFFLINEHRSIQRSVQIPNYIKNWITEFNFHEIENEKYSFLIFSCLIFRVRYQFDYLLRALEEIVEKELIFREIRSYLIVF